MFSTDKLILGTVQFGLNYGINNSRGQVSAVDAFRILKVAKESSVLSLDTAAAYGSSENIIGQFLDKYGKDSFKVITKFSSASGLSLASSFEKSLENLNTNHIDTVLFHSYAHYEQNKGAISSLKKLKKKGAFSRLGVSVYTNEELLALVEENDIEVVQAPFNLLDNHSRKSEIFKALKKSGKDVHVRSVFLQGAFFMEDKDFPKRMLPLLEEVRKVRKIAMEFGVDVGALALQYACSKPYIDGVLIGLDSLEQLERNLLILEVDIPYDCFEQIDKLVITMSKMLNPTNWKS